MEQGNHLFVHRVARRILRGDDHGEDRRQLALNQLGQVQIEKVSLALGVMALAVVVIVGAWVLN